MHGHLMDNIFSSWKQIPKGVLYTVQDNLHGALCKDVMYGSDSRWAEKYGAAFFQTPLRQTRRKHGVSIVFITTEVFLKFSLKIMS